MSTKKNILVTGAKGQLGMEFRQLEKKYDAYTFFFVTKEELSIIDSSAVDQFFKENQIDICLNCAAYTAVDKAEIDKDASIAVNVLAVKNLAAVCKRYDCLFIHFSTDYVFDGTAQSPYKETDTTSPVNFYGQTKLEGEHEAIKENENCIIIRTSWVYSSHGKNFVKTMLRLMCEKESVGVVNDQFGSPTYAGDLAEAVMKIIISKNPVKGIYHYCNNGIISWFDFAKEIKQLINSKCVLQPIATASYPTPAKRPAYSALNTDKIIHTYNIQIPTWKESLSKCISLLWL